MKASPCMNCRTRKMYCHSYCEKYKEYDRLRQELKKENELTGMLNAHILYSKKRFTGIKIKER